jgi:hypothetical protein
MAYANLWIRLGRWACDFSKDQDFIDLTAMNDSIFNCVVLVVILIITTEATQLPTPTSCIFAAN